MPKAKGQLRLSAVARQRSLRNAATSPISGSKTNTKIQRNVNNGAAEASSYNETAVQDELVELDDSPLNENQFSGLIASGNVSFISARRIECVNDASVKVLLEHGQKCVLFGICSLWVKAGKVSVYGASLTESLDTYLIYAPTTHALPVIEAVTKTAEFQLDSVDDGLQELPGIGHPQLWKPSRITDSPGWSFYIQGYSFDHDGKLPRRAKELNTEPWKKTLHNMTTRCTHVVENSGSNAEEAERSKTTTFLIHGQQQYTVSTFFRCLINHFLTFRKHDGNLSFPHGLLIIDLDSNNPEFSAPGTLAVVRVDRPVFGPPFTHMCTPGLETATILKAHFVGDIAGDTVPHWVLERLLDLLRLARSQQAKSQRAEDADLPILIKTASWLNTINAKTMQSLWSELDISAIAFLGNNSNSMISQWWEVFAARQNCVTYQFQDDASIPEYDRTREHDIQMQSIFHTRTEPSKHLHWEPLPILADVCALQTVAYCGEAAVLKAIVILAEGIVMENTCNVLEESIAAVVAVDDNAFEDANNAGLISRTSEGLPRLMITPGNEFPITARSSRFLGLVYVHAVQTASGTLQMHSTFCMEHWQSANDTTEVLFLVVHRGLPDGRYQSQWIRKELEDSDTSDVSLEPGVVGAESPAGQETS